MKCKKRCKQSEKVNPYTVPRIFWDVTCLIYTQKFFSITSSTMLEGGGILNKTLTRHKPSPEEKKRFVFKYPVELQWIPTEMLMITVLYTYSYVSGCLLLIPLILSAEF